MVLVEPLDSAFRSVVAPCCCRVVGEQVDSADSRLLAGRFFEEFKLLLVILYENIGRVPKIVVVLAAVFLLTRNDVVSVLVAEVIVEILGSLRSVRIGKLARGRKI